MRDNKGGNSKGENSNGGNCERGNRPRILLTGSSGRIGRAIFHTLSPHYEIIGLDRIASATSTIVAEIDDQRALDQALQGVQAVIHTAALHAPHVGVADDGEFQRINVAATRLLAQMARERGITRFVFTSTTALYGHAIVPGECRWIDEDTVPQPRTIYHFSKQEAEGDLREMAAPQFQIRTLRMSRCFPEPANLMAIYRLHRGVDARDVARAHALVLDNGGADYQCYIISGQTPFTRDDCAALARDPRGAIARRAPRLLERMDQLQWKMAQGIDRVYSPHLAAQQLGWVSRFGPEEVLAQAARGDAAVLAPEMI